MKSTIDALLVEDSSSDAQLVKKIINLASVDKPIFHHVRRFNEALTVLEVNTFDIILLDLHLPDGEGLSLIKRLKQLAPQTPIVVLTGLQDQTVVEAALQAGVQDYVVKSDFFSPAYLKQLGYVNVGHQLVQRIQYAIKRTESSQRLNQDQERYALIAQEANDGIWDWNLTTDSIYYSPQWKSLLGLEHIPLSDNPDEWLSRIHPEDQDLFEKKLNNYLQQQQQSPFHCEYRIQHQNGDYLWVLTRATAMWDPAGVAYRLVGCQTDMSIKTQLAHTSQQGQDATQSTLHYIAIGILSNLANLHLEQDQPDEAVSLLEGTLMMRKWLLGNDHVDVMANVYQLATLYDNQGRYKKAKFLYQEALALFEENLGEHHPTTNVVRIKVLLITRMNDAMGV
ncbi:PAS domain-containing protein [Adonisia turfae]|uniref:histidine kinase n=1 Tax=Adonisia turfae CCMR0081 TaxID=2292702 RepID=A0A6M0RN97_9CYAN|nr:PAS domain-containing protein [Adonisia turfae]NEZ57121.1 response regulator [Adonisia turfae CCMR0081]